MGGVRAAILAAGRGVRMGGTKPKTLFPVAGNKSLLHYLLQGLRHAGVNDLLVVTGFLPASVQDFVTEHWGEDGVAFVRNARYASWGNFHTVRMAIDQSTGRDLLVVNSDIVIHPEVFRRASIHPGTSSCPSSVATTSTRRTCACRSMEIAPSRSARTSSPTATRGSSRECHC